MLRLLIAGSLLLFLASCLNPPNYSEIPEISFDSLNATFVKVGQDSITFFIGFTDGDGDLGSEEVPNLFFLDSRTGKIDSNKIPNITPEGTIKAVSGTIAFNQSSFTCSPPEGREFDTLFYTIYVEDRAGHKSNEVVTPQIILDCN